MRPSQYNTWRRFSKHVSSRCPTHLKCVLGYFTWVLASYPSHKMPLQQYLLLCETWSLNESSVCVFMRSNGGEGSTFLHLLQMSHYSFNNSCTVLAQKVAPSEKKLKLKWGRKWRNQQIMMLKEYWR